MLLESRLIPHGYKSSCHGMQLFLFVRAQSKTIAFGFLLFLLVLDI